MVGLILSNNTQKLRVDSGCYIFCNGHKEVEMNTDNLGNENIDMAVGYSNGYKKGYEDGKKDAVKHGHWVKRNTIGSATCSECDGVIYNAYDKSANKFCHVCGAKMD